MYLRCNNINNIFGYWYSYYVSAAKPISMIIVWQNGNRKNKLSFKIESGL